MLIGLNKLLYGCVKSALLSHDLFPSTLMEMGFEVNHCDACVANAIIHEKKFTICQHEDDNMLSHVDASEVMK